MKIAYLLDSVSRRSGGLLESTRRLAQAIAQHESVSAFGVVDEFTDVDLKDWSPLQPKIFPPVGPRSFGFAPGYAKELMNTAPDVAHVHGLWTYHSLAAFRWHRSSKRPLIYSSHGMLEAWALQNSAWKKRLVRALWENAAHRSAACFHVLSEAEYRSVREYGLRNPICVIPNGIDLPKQVESRKEKVEIEELTSDLRPLTSGTKLLLYLGRLHPKKNLAALLKAWTQIRNSKVEGRKGEEWTLVIAGWDQGGYEGELKQLAHELELTFAEVRGQTSEVSKSVAADTAASRPSVVFAGPIFGEEKANTFCACDAFVLPSLSEGLPMSILEAWAYAKPVLMTSECNLPEGFNVNAALRIGTSENEISAGLRQLFEMNDDDRATMGAHGRSLVAEKFSWPKIGQQMREVYQWVLGGGAPPVTVRLD